VSRAELDAAGVTDPLLRASYERCRRLNAAHGRTYYLAALLLPPAKRPYVHALYGFARYADEIVDDTGSQLTEAEREHWLTDWGGRFVAAVRDGHRPEHPIGVAAADTLRRWDIPLSYVEDFLASMRTDLTVREYATFEDLMRYMWGSAAVIGLQMLPVLEPVVERDVAQPYAVDLGVAFQLSNFIRDVGEDLRRGRVYLPMADLAHFGVDRARLARCVVDGPVRRLLAYEIARARELYRSAEPGIRLLHPTSRDCISTALRLYRGILDRVERADYQVLDRRQSVSRLRRATVLPPALVHAYAARRRWRRTG
jgi:phytoene synthase